MTPPPSTPASTPASTTPVTLRRIFRLGDLTLADPNPNMTPEQVRTFYKTEHAELATAGIGSPEDDLAAGERRIQFIPNYGRKG